MSMIYCRGCGHQIHEMAVACPNCGAPQKTQSIASIKQNPTTIGQLLFSFEGRIPRSTYWQFSLLLVMIYGISFLIDSSGGLATILTVCCLYSTLAMGAKRCHDVNRSGWFMLIQLIPILNFWPLIELGFMRGTRGDNQYGADPLKLGE